jgi:hypothetical protein
MSSVSRGTSSRIEMNSSGLEKTRSLAESILCEMREKIREVEFMGKPSF